MGNPLWWRIIGRSSDGAVLIYKVPMTSYKPVSGVGRAFEVLKASARHGGDLTEICRRSKRRGPAIDSH